MNLTQLRTIVRDLTKTSLSTSDGGTVSGGDANFTDATVNIYLTNAAHIMTTEVVQGMDDWDFQGETAVTNLIANQREYVFPTDILIIKRVEAQFDGVNWIRLKPINESEIRNVISNETSITQRFNNIEPYFSTIERGLYIYSGTITGVNNGLKIWYTKEIVGKDTSVNPNTDITSFPVDSTPTHYSPTLAAAFQEGLCYFTAKKYFEGFGDKIRSDQMDGQFEKIIIRLRSHYAQRIEPRFMRLKGQGDLSNYE